MRRNQVSKLVKFKIFLGGVLALVALVGFVGWYKFFREVPQAPFADYEMQFKYGSLGAENDRGLPYWIWLVLPRIFPEYLPGPGGYKALGMAWEPGQEVPAGFAKKTVGFPRVTNNCAACHTAVYRTKENELPTFVAAGPGHTSNVQEYFRFLFKAANDVRFNADEIMREINIVTELSWLDRMLYRYAIIPFTKKGILEQEKQLAWMDRPGMPDSGPGRDDPMNLTKYFMTSLPWDDSTGNADFPSIWNLAIREPKRAEQSLNWDGATPSPRSVIIDSALGLGAPPGAAFLKQMAELEAWLKALPPPKYPYPVNPQQAKLGSKIFDEYCATCHALDGARVNTVIDIAEIGTDRERLDTWTQAAADAANAKVKSMGIVRKDMVKTNGYVSPPLDGIWLRAPYLHNGAVANMHDLLEPEDKRAPVFFRGYDVYDPVNLGFIARSLEAERVGFRFDTGQRGNGNYGHRYGTELPPGKKKALIEYLKTL